MMHLVLKKTLMKMILMHSVTAVNITTRKQQRFILELGIITQVRVDLSAVIHTQEEDLIRLV